MSKILNYYKRCDLSELLSQYCNNRDINDKFKIILDDCLMYAANKNIPKSIKDLEAQWYTSLEKDEIDYSVYDDQFYIADVWTCWVQYSRKYLKSLINPKSLPGTNGIIDHISNLYDIKSVVDLGNAFGFTTGVLSDYFPTATVTGINIPDTTQYKIAEEYGKIYKFNMCGTIDELTSGDVIYATEYFEHIINPIDHLKDVVNKLDPKIMIIANSFGTIAIGHFIKYKVDNKFIDGKKMGRLFNKTMRLLGYKRLPAKIWNNKPAIWIK